MATATRTRKASTTKTAAKAKGKTAAKAKVAPKTDEGPSKSELRAQRDAEMTERMLEMRAEGEPWSAIGEELSITPGKAQFLMMLHRVDTGDVKPLKWTDDESLTEVCQEARAALDEFSSWGWIAARTGVSEGKIKRLLEEAGAYVPKEQNIAVERAIASRDEEDEPKAKAKKAAATKRQTSATAAACGSSHGRRRAPPGGCRTRCCARSPTGR